METVNRFGSDQGSLKQSPILAKRQSKSKPEVNEARGVTITRLANDGIRSFPLQARPNVYDEV